VPGGHAIVAVRADDAKAQFGGFGGGGADMMTQMAPMLEMMLEMMKAKIGKRRFAMLMQTMGPMMGRMVENGGFGSVGAEIPGGFGGAMQGGFDSSAQAATAAPHPTHQP
jgi:hypothetical protein